MTVRQSGGLRNQDQNDRDANQVQHKYLIMLTNHTPSPGTAEIIPALDRISDNIGPCQYVVINIPPSLSSGSKKDRIKKKHLTFTLPGFSYLECKLLQVLEVTFDLCFTLFFFSLIFFVCNQIMLLLFFSFDFVQMFPFLPRSCLLYHKKYINS